MFSEHDRVGLTSDIDASKLKTGDVGTIVHVYPERAAFEVEFVAPDGQSSVVTTVLPSQMRPVGRTDIKHAREMAGADGATAPRDRLR